MSSGPRLKPGKARTRSGARDGQRPDGIITGYVLKLIRGSLGLSQFELAELLQVDPNTVQGWESGRRSLAATSVSSLVGLRYRLRGLGAHPRLIAALDVAMDADYLRSFIVSDEAETASLSAHPLAVLVTTQGMNEMLAWPFTGKPPGALQVVGPVPRRGPVAAAPTVSRAEANRFFERLRTTAERSLKDPATPRPLMRCCAARRITWRAGTPDQRHGVG
jgi:transcriptional regulator with XRE-family HTH domain